MAVNRTTYQRRLKTAQYMIQGITPTETVERLSKEYGVSVRTIWEDWRKRDKWLPILLQTKNQEAALNQLLLEWNHVRRMLFNIALTTDRPGTRVMALKEITDQISREIELRQSLGLLPLKPVRVEVKEQRLDIQALLILIGQEKPELLDQIIEMTKIAEAPPAP